MASQFMQRTVGGEGGHWQVHQTEAVEMACNAPHTCACHNIPTHVHLSSSIPMCSPNLSTHMHRRPDSKVFNMSPFGTNLSALTSPFSGRCSRGTQCPLVQLNVLDGRLCNRSLYQMLDTFWTLARGGTENPVLLGLARELAWAQFANRWSLSSNCPDINSYS